MPYSRLAKKCLMCEGKLIILSVAACITAKPVDGIKANGSLVIYIYIYIQERGGKWCLKERMGDTIKIFVYKNYPKEMTQEAIN